MSPKVEEILSDVEMMLEAAGSGEEIGPLTVLDRVRDLREQLEEEESCPTTC